MATRIDLMRKVRPQLSAILTLYTLVLAGIVLISGDPGGESGAEWLYFIPVTSATAMGLFLAMRRPENPIGTLSSLTGAALVTLGANSTLVPLAAESGNDVLTVLLLLGSDTAWIVQIVCALVLLPLWFPTGSAINRRWAWLGRVAIVCATLAWVSFVLGDTVCLEYASPESSTCTATRQIPWSVGMIPNLEVLLLVTMAMALPAIASVFVRLRRSHGVEREQLKWVLLAVSLVAIGIVLSFEIWAMPQWINDGINALTLGGLWVAIAVAIVRYRLYDIDRIISRTVSYVLVLGVLGLVVFGLIGLLAAFLPSNDPLVVAVATLAAFALFTPLRRRVQGWVDRRFNRSRYDAERVANRFSGSLQDRVDPAEITSDWVDVVSETMQPTSIGLWIRR